MIPYSDDSREGVYRDGQVHLDETTDWPDGTRLRVTPIVRLDGRKQLDGHVIIVGFGLAGRCVADLLEQADIPYTIVERNPVTVATQRALGRQIIFGDAIEAKVLNDAGLANASILALTIPDEDAVLDATSLARRLKPDIFIVARTNYSSKGMKATQLGADDVVKAEQAVALQFYDKVQQQIHQMTESKNQQA